jgi:hypothetical protein
MNCKTWWKWEGCIHPDVCWVNAARPRGANTAADRSQAKLHTVQPREGLKVDFMYVFTIFNISKSGIW